MIFRIVEKSWDSFTLSIFNCVAEDQNIYREIKYTTINYAEIELNLIVSENSDNSI